MDKLEGKGRNLHGLFLMEAEHRDIWSQLKAYPGITFFRSLVFTYQSAIFEYWALDNPDGKKAGCPGETFPVTENVVFYASWRLVIVIPGPKIRLCVFTHGANGRAMPINIGGNAF